MSKPVVFSRLAGACAALALLGSAPAKAQGIGSRVFVVERESGSFAVYDLATRSLLKSRVEGFGDLRHAVMTFSPDLRYGFVATRNGKLTRVDLETLKTSGDVFTSQNSIDIAISQDGRYIATAEYAPGGVTILDAATLEVRKRLPATFEHEGKVYPSRVTGIVDAPGNRFVCVAMEATEVWIVDASTPEPRIEHRIETVMDLPYDAMITPDGRFYVVGHMGSNRVSVVDLTRPRDGARVVTLDDPKQAFEKKTPGKLPHMASWAVAQGRVFVPLVGEKRLVVLDAQTWEFVQSVPVRGHPVYAVRQPNQREVWVSFSGEQDDKYVQVIDTGSLAVTRTIEVGGRIYHMDFTPRGSHLLASANRDNKLVLVNAATYQIEDQEEVRSPSGVFGVWRAFMSGL